MTTATTRPHQHTRCRHCRTLGRTCGQLQQDLDVAKATIRELRTVAAMVRQEARLERQAAQQELTRLAGLVQQQTEHAAACEREVERLLEGMADMAERMDRS